MAHPHASVSSSVYSPVESTHQFLAQYSPIQEDDSRLDSSSVATSSHPGFATEPLSQTFRTFYTAQESLPSFLSINNSLVRPDDTDNDNTPIVALQAAFDNDRTPIVGAWPDDPLDPHTPTIDAGLHHSPAPNVGSPSPGQRHRADSPSEVVSTFQRLSLTLNQNTNKVSRELQQFQVNFSQNALKANMSDTAHPKASRKSAYYNRIHAKPEELSHGDTFDTLSTLNALSVASNASGFSLPLHGDTRDTSNDTSKLLRSHAFPTARPQHDQDLSSANLSFSSASQTDYDQPIDMSVLFIRAVHSFDSSESQVESESSVCLSFEKDDIAFVHTIDDSGWGEVTLIETLDRGWIPMNFFAVIADFSANADDQDGEKAVFYAKYMTPLLNSCAKFLLNPISHTTSHGFKTFSVKAINEIRDGVRYLLQKTDCLSRSNEIVIKRPLVRKCRKTLLYDWYNLMTRASDFRGTRSFDKIEILTLLVLHVIRRATKFLDCWVAESKEVVKRDTESFLKNDMQKYPLLDKPPLAKQRLTEINLILNSYLAIIIGRLDLVEHNPSGCDMLESLVHHIILLLRELLFISKTGSDFHKEKPFDLDNSLDVLLSLVSQLVTSVKSLVISTLNETDRHRSINTAALAKADYSYTEEGASLIEIAAQMVKAIGVTLACIRKAFDALGDFKLSAERSYPDYRLIRITPEAFIKSCSVGMVKSLALEVKDLRQMKLKNTQPSNRYSTFRCGSLGDLGITANGVESLHKALLIDTESSVPFSSNMKEFKAFAPSSDTISSTFSIKDELLTDANGKLLGASFKGLIYLLTDESGPPDFFFVSAFFLSFRGFASSLDLAEQLIARFDNTEFASGATSAQDLLVQVKLKSRKKLVCTIFKTWMESYWQPVHDQAHFSTIVNFFNENVANSLPFEAMQLIETASNLVARKPTESQLMTRSVSLAKSQRKNSLTDAMESGSTLNSRYSMVDGYELSRIDTNGSNSGATQAGSLPLSLGLNGAFSPTTPLLTKGQHVAIETLVINFRKILSEHWCPQQGGDQQRFFAIPLETLLPKWFALYDQNWVLSNYRTNLLDFNGLEVAKQLTLIESQIFCAIEPSELVDRNFTAKNAHLNLAPNVRQSILFTNSLSEYVLESILQPNVNHKVRVNIMRTWLKIAISCLYLRNFNSLAAVITSLQSHLITRLDRIWADLSKKYIELYEYLCCIIHPNKNYSVYRSRLRNFLVANDYNVPVVPYFSLFLQDLTFVTDGNPNFRKADTFLGQKLINFDKYLKIARVIADIESLQIPYDHDVSGARSSRYLLPDLNLSGNLMDFTIAGVPALQELIMLELWKISQVNKKENDRAWKLSCAIQPREPLQGQK